MWCPGLGGEGRAPGRHGLPQLLPCHAQSPLCFPTGPLCPTGPCGQAARQLLHPAGFPFTPSTQTQITQRRPAPWTQQSWARGPPGKGAVRRRWGRHQSLPGVQPRGLGTHTRVRGFIREPDSGVQDRRGGSHHRPLGVLGAVDPTGRYFQQVARNMGLVLRRGAKATGTWLGWSMGDIHGGPGQGGQAAVLRN